MTLKERWARDIIEPIPVPYEKMTEEQKKETERLKNRTPEELKADEEKLMEMAGLLKRKDK